jgi:hypothetical protein
MRQTYQSRSQMSRRAASNDEGSTTRHVKSTKEDDLNITMHLQLLNNILKDQNL